MALRRPAAPGLVVLLGHARRLLDANDAAVLAVRGSDARTTLRLGLTQDMADAWLAPLLDELARDLPDLVLDLQGGRSEILRQAWLEGELDLAAVFGQADDGDANALRRLDVQWWGGAGYRHEAGAPVSLLLATPCAFREAALAALSQAGVPWRIAMSSDSLPALWSAVAAGLGLTARTALHVPASGIAAVTEGLPALPQIGLFLHAAAEAGPGRQVASRFRALASGTGQAVP